jgi:hypothetical protein
MLIRRAASRAAAAIPSATFTMTQLPDAKRIYQRIIQTGGGQSKGYGTIPVTISVTVAGAVYARIRSFADGLTILQAPWLVNANVGVGASQVLNVTGVDARLGWFYVDLSGDGVTWTNGTTQTGMGALFGFAGQSLTARLFGRQDGQVATYASLGITPNANSSVLATYNESNAYMPTVATMPWQTPGDVGDGLGPNSVGVGEFLNRMITMLGINCGATGHSQGGVSIATFFTGQSNWTQLSAVLARAGGAFEAFFWGQGHSDSAYGLPGQVYSDCLTTLFSQITAANTFSGYKKFVWTIPAIGSASWGTPWEYNHIRKGAADWCAANSATYVHMYDFAQVDTIHESQAGAVTMARHMYRATRAGYSQTGGIGPQPVSATRVGTTITLTLSDVGQTTLSLVGTPANRIFVFATGRVNTMAAPNNNRFPVSNVVVTNKTTLTITLANDPGDAHVLDMYLYYPAGPANGTTDNIYDDRLDGDGITTGRIVQANPVPITIAAPNPGGATNAPPSGFVAATSPFNMTETSTTYAAGAAGFGNEMTGGTAIMGGNAPGFAPFTIRGRFTCPVITGSVQVLFGNINGSNFIAVNSSGQISTGAGTGATVLTAGKRL